jgi:hypothetical protein
LSKFVAIFFDTIVAVQFGQTNYKTFTGKPNKDKVISVKNALTNCRRFFRVYLIGKFVANSTNGMKMARIFGVVFKVAPEFEDEVVDSPGAGIDVITPN